MGDKPCPFCGPDLDRLPSKALRHGHRLYLVSAGTVWRLWRAPTKDECMQSVRTFRGFRGVALNRASITLATEADLALIAETRTAEKAVRA